MGRGRMKGTSIKQIDPMITPDKTLPNKRTAMAPVDVSSLNTLNGNMAGDGSMYFFKYFFIPAFLMPKNGIPTSTIIAKAPVVDSEAVGDLNSGISVIRLHVRRLRVA